MAACSESTWQPPARPRVRLILDNPALQANVRVLQRAFASLDDTVGADLAAASGLLDLAADNAAPATVAELDAVTSRLRALARRLSSHRRALATPAPAQRHPSRVDDLIDAAIAAAGDTTGRTVRRTRHTGIAPIDVDPIHLALGIAPLIANAMAAHPDEPCITIRQSDRFVEIAVADAGYGPGDADFERLPEPLAELAEPPHWGLGLTIAWACGRCYGGGIMLSSPAPDGGFEAALLLARPA